MNPTFTRRDIFGYLTIDHRAYWKAKNERAAHQAFLLIRQHFTSWTIMAAVALPVLTQAYA